MTLRMLEQGLTERGWAVLDLPDPVPVLQARDRLLEHLRTGPLPSLRRLDDYHTQAGDDERHVSILHDLAQYYWSTRLGHAIITANLDLFRGLLGPDLLIQKEPYLRAVRPGVVRDAAPLHRDTYYGASPYELSVLVPFTDVEAAGAMRVLSGSHLEPDSAYPYRQETSEDVRIRSPKHRLGFAYAPRLLDPALMEEAEPVPLKVGQALLFGLSLVHGGGVNQSSRTRFSTDIRVANALAPVSRSRGVNPEYFIPLSASPITRTAETYLARNQTGAGRDDRSGSAA